MKFSKSFKLALNILVHAKIRSWLTIIGIVIGVAAIVAIMSIGQGAQASVNDRLGGLGADIGTVSGGFQRARGGFGGGGEGGGGSGGLATSKNLTDKDVQIIKGMQDVLFVDGMISGRASTIFMAQTASLSITGVDSFAWINMQTSELAEGRFLTPSDKFSVVIGNRVATSTFKQPIGINRIISIGGKPFKVVGILAASGGFGGSDNGITMPIEEARIVLDRTGTTDVDSIQFKVADANRIADIVNATTLRLMMSRHVTARNQDFTINTAQATQARIASITGTFTLFLAAIAAVSLLVGAVGIANTMFTAVLEKTREIGIMKAIGAKNKDILIIFLLNSGLVGLAGGLIGIALGVGITYLAPNVLSGLGGGIGAIKTIIPINLLIEAIVLSVSIGMIAGAIPAYRASKLKPVDALRYD